MSRKIAISVDSSPISKQALDWAAAHVLRPSDQVVLLTVVEPSVKSELEHVHAPAIARGTLDQVGWVLPLGAVKCEADPEQLKRSEAFLADCKKELAGKGISAAAISTQPLVACIGNSHDIGRQIIDYTEEHKCESLVMGSRGMGLGKRSLLGIFGLGSVSDYVVKHANVNVIVHKSAAAAATK